MAVFMLPLYFPLLVMHTAALKTGVTTLQVMKGVYCHSWPRILTVAFVKWLAGGAYPHQYEEEEQRPYHFYDQPHLHKGNEMVLALKSVLHVSSSHM